MRQIRFFDFLEKYPHLKLSGFELFLKRRRVISLDVTQIAHDTYPILPKYPNHLQCGLILAPAKRRRISGGRAQRHRQSTGFGPFLSFSQNHNLPTSAEKNAGDGPPFAHQPEMPLGSKRAGRLKYHFDNPL